MSGQSNQTPLDDAALSKASREANERLKLRPMERGTTDPTIQAEVDAALSKFHKQRSSLTFPDTITFSLPTVTVRGLQKATSEVPYLLGNAASIFGLLYKLTAGGFAPDEGSLCSLYELCQSGLSAACENEGEAIDSFDMTLREALSKLPEAEA